MTEIDPLIHWVTAALPDAVWELDAAPEGSRRPGYGSVRLREEVVLLEWHADGTIGLTRGEDVGLGAQADEVWGNLHRAAVRIVSLLQGERTARPTSLRRLREQAGLTQFDIGQRLGIQQAAVSKLERRADPEIASVVGYIRAVGGQPKGFAFELGGQSYILPLVEETVEPPAHKAS